MAANLFWVGEGRAPRGGGTRERVRGIPMPREKGGIYRQDRIIGDSLFLLTFPSHVLFQFTRPIYRLCSIDYSKLFVPPFFAIHLSFEPHVLHLID